MRLLTLEEAVASLRAGEAVIMPTDTVCGVGVAVGAAESPAPLFRAKRRPADKPVAWLVGSVGDLDRYGRSVPDYARVLAEAFWPGALTLVVSASDEVPAAFQSAAGTIGLRMPSCDDTLALIAGAASPLAVTSANFSGALAPLAVCDVDEAFAARTAGVFEGAGNGTDTPAPGAPPLPSTVLDCTGSAPRLLREGALDWETLKGALS
ncbi:L-threonylcarbamoyladenylate synthase [uncultured Adlercreutzia sp.]|uniref:L-threonylcarbamoyladenylate synthase n=1 Tax=uncultured Adlercreutzia sp. TaxID=875803 RepID=UPI0026F3B12E|nr:L-threonylcarbamoyladenylate synthase [uncultured Adlercreutzia sp.]